MLKKRLIFTLLFNNGYFMLSRNFNLQRVGNIEWLNKNYNFSKIAFSIDELIILDVTRNNRNIDNFCQHIKEISKVCFVPISAGGGVSSLADANKILRSGADKLVFNSSLYNNTTTLNNFSKVFGAQCIVASVDIKKINNEYSVLINNGSFKINLTANEWLDKISKFSVGEIYLNSIEKDGTGQGYDFEMLDLLPEHISLPIILSGGAGHHNHLLEGLKHPRVDAVSTAHLFNFVGDGLQKARINIINNNISLAKWKIPNGI